MLGDDACVTFMELLKKILEIIGEQERISNGKEKAYKTPKIRSGELSKKELERFMKNGTDFKYVTVPADKLEDIENTVKRMGGSYFSTEIGDGKNAVMAVPSNQLDIINTALKHAVSKELAENPDAVKIKDGNDLIDAEDMKIVKDVLNKHDIPVVSFKTDSGKYMNIVPSEYEGQYNDAIKEANALKKELENIDVTRYDQTAPLDSLDYEAHVVSKDEAEELAAAARENDLDISFAKNGSDTVAMYKKDISEKIDSIRNEYNKSVEESEDFLIDIKDNSVTLDVSKLMNPELNDNDSYFMRVPNTSGQDYIRIGKDESELINGGKTLSARFDSERKYPIYDRGGNVKREENGDELARYFNTRSKYANKDTQVYNYGTKPGFDRIELYNSKKNELISIKTDSAENVKIALKERGLNKKTIDKLLGEINERLDGKQKEIFNYTAEKSAVVYADIPNIGEYLAQSQLSQTVIGKAECIGEIPKDNGAKCCVMDRNTNSFAVIPVLPLKEVQAKLSQMGYSEISAKEIADKIVGSYRDTDIIPDKAKSEKVQNAELKRFDTSNIQLSDMGFAALGNGTLIVKDNADSFKCTQIAKTSSLSDIERSLADDFNLDSISVAIAVKSLIKENAIHDSIKTKEHENARIDNLTSKIVEITNTENGKSVMCHKDNIDASRLVEIGLSEKCAASISKSFEIGLENQKHPQKQTLRDLCKYAAEKFREAKQSAKGADKEKMPDIGKEQGR